MINLIQVERDTFPNFALMKLAKYYRSAGETVTLNGDVWTSDKTFISSVFSFSEKPDLLLFGEFVTGGTGYDIVSQLPTEIEDGEPDYSLYPDFKHALGFLTRGCTRKCNFCVVPQKEGKIRSYRDAETIMQGRESVILMDNNVLSSSHGLQQIEWLADKKIKVDFNQGLDARLIDKEKASLLSRVKWLKNLRMSCDSEGDIEAVERAVSLLRRANCHPDQYFIYLLGRDFESAYRRINFCIDHYLDPFLQPFIEPGSPVKNENKRLKRLARWCNLRKLRRTCSFEEFEKSYK